MSEGAGPSWTVITPARTTRSATRRPTSTTPRARRFTASASYDIRRPHARGARCRSGQARADAAARRRPARTTASASPRCSTPSDWLGFRGTYDQAKRTAEGETLYGFQVDEAERKTKRTGIDVELTPTTSLDLTFAYFRRDVEYPNRPDRIPVTSGAPTPGAAAHTRHAQRPARGEVRQLTGGDSTSRRASGLEFERLLHLREGRTTNQWSTTTGVTLNNLLNYAGNDKTNTFGVNAIFQLVPEKWTFTANAMRQKVDGLMDITAREAGSFYTPGRTTLIPAGSGRGPGHRRLGRHRADDRRRRSSTTP